MTTDANTTNTEHPTGTGPVRRRGTAAGVLGAATVAMGLIAGVFYIFACAIMPALARSDDRVFIEVMQNVNDVIQNPVFFLSFLGALALTAVAAWQSRGAPHRWWVFAALAAYALAVVLTAAVNIPLNDDLAAAGAPPGSPNPPPYATASRTPGWPGTSYEPRSRPSHWPASPARCICSGVLRRRRTWSPRPGRARAGSRA